MKGERNYTTVISAGRIFMATCSMYWNPWSHANMIHPQQPYEIEARNLYNGKILWRRPISARFGDMSSLMAATPDRLYVKEDAGILVLNPETGAEISRIAVTKDPQAVRWLVLSDGVLVTIAGPKPYLETVDNPPNKKTAPSAEDPELVPIVREREFCDEIAAWDPATGKMLWQAKEPKIQARKTAVSDGRLFLYVKESEALCLDLKTGKELWRKPAPSTATALTDYQRRYERRGEMLALASPGAYVIMDHYRKQSLAFDAKTGGELWNLPGGAYPLVFGNTLIAGKELDLLTGNPSGALKYNSNFCKGDSCGHATGVEPGLWIGNGIWDLTTGQQLMPFLAKSGCGMGFFVADGVEFMYPNMCGCGYWRGTFAVRAAAPRAQRATETRFEKGDAPASVETKCDGCDWPTYRSDETRKGSSAATVPAKAGIRWIYAPPRPPAELYLTPLPAPLEKERTSTPPVAVGSSVWFGTADGAVVCLDSATGKEKWKYWTAGAIKSSPTWWQGRIYAGSADGWVYCLDAVTGKMSWRYRVAPEERRIGLLGGLGSAWPVWSNVLVHDGVAYAAAGIRGKLDGSALAALDAKTGAVRWEKFFKNSKTDSNGEIVNEAPSGGGQMAWFNGKLWWNGGEFGPVIVDPATGSIKKATEYRAARDFTKCQGQDIGIMPGGWVALGGWVAVKNNGEIGMTSRSLLLRCGPDGVPGADPNAKTITDASTIPHFVSLSDTSRIGRQIPVWDDKETLLPGETDKKERRPLLCTDFAKLLDAADDAQPPDLDALNKLQYWQLDFDSAIHGVAASSFPADKCRPLLPDPVGKQINSRQHLLSGMMLLSSNAAVFTYAMSWGYPGTETHGLRAVAVSRTDGSLLWQVTLPAPVGLCGISMTRGGDTLIPLMDGRIVCIGAADKEIPVPAADPPNTQPGLFMRGFASDAGSGNYTFWTPGDFAIMKPAGTAVLAESQFKEEKPDGQTVAQVEGYLEVPETAKYVISVRAPAGKFVLWDSSRQYMESEFDLSGSSEELFLEKGKHPVSITVIQGTSGKSFSMQWKKDGGQPEDIPGAALSHLPR